MSNKQWLLNHAALTKAKECIRIIEKELDIRLKLTHPQFLDMIKDYAEMTDSEKLQQCFAELAEMAGINTAAQVVEEKTVVNISHYVGAPPTTQQPLTITAKSTQQEEYVLYKGKSYRRFNNMGKEFKGLYRGQARYA